MMRLRATVRTVIGTTRHLLGVPSPSGLTIAQLPDPIAVEIEEADGAFFLLRLNCAGVCVADTWHETLEEAKSQASSEYGIEESDWKEGSGAIADFW
jgi:hypothetical protein